MGRPRRLWERLGLLSLCLRTVRVLAAQLPGSTRKPSQGVWIILLKVLSPLRILAWRWSALFVRLVKGHMLVEDIKCLFGGRKLDRKDALAIVNRLRGTLAQFGAFSIRRAVLVQQRVVAIVGEAKAIILSAVPAIVEAVSIPIDLLYCLDTALCYCPLLPHSILWVWR